MKINDHHIPKSKKRKKPLTGSQLLKKQQSQIISYKIFNDIYVALDDRVRGLTTVMKDLQKKDVYMVAAGYRSLIDGVDIAKSDIEKVQKEWRLRNG